VAPRRRSGTLTPTPDDEHDDRAPRRSRGLAAGPWLVLAVLAGAVVAVAALGGAVAWMLESQRDEVEVAAGPAGASAEGFDVWSRNDDGVPVRWDPCSPIDLVLDPTDAPAGAAADLEEAVDRLRDASGLDLRVLGTTDESPTGNRPPYQPERYGERWAPVLVAWARPGDDGNRLRDTDRGVAVPVAAGPEGDRTYVTGQIVLHAGRDDLVAGFEDRARSWGSTLLHELVHVLGLGHVDDPDELMYVHPGDGPVELGPGDLAGLAAVGPDHGCRDVPAPGPVEVADPSR
jgi:hypothetical protein